MGLSSRHGQSTRLGSHRLSHGKLTKWKETAEKIIKQIRGYKIGGWGGGGGGGGGGESSVDLVLNPVNVKGLRQGYREREREGELFSQTCPTTRPCYASDEN